MQTETINRVSAMSELYNHKLAKYMPQLSVNCVTLGFHAGMLKVLLYKMGLFQKWMLPGGFVYHDEDVDEAASRILEYRTSLKDIYLRQYYLFGHKDRTAEDDADEILNLLKVENTENHWLRQRFLSVAYYALVESGQVEVRSQHGEELSWFCLHELPDLYMDHNNIIEKAIQSIRNDVGYIPIGYELLPPKFTMPELRTIYETILGRELDRRNFQRKMLSTGLIIPLNETRKDGAYKSPNLYSFNKERYDQALVDGIPLMHVTL